MSEQTVDKILQAAAKLFAARGIASVTIHDVASSAGIASGTVIYHFKSKNNLLFILARHIFYSLHGQASRAMEEAASPRESLLRFIDSFFDHAAESPEDIVFISRLDPFFSLNLAIFPNADLSMIKDRYIGLIVECLHNGVRSGDFPAVDPWPLATLIWAMLRGAAVLAGEGTDISCLGLHIKDMLAARLAIEDVRTRQSGRDSQGNTNQEGLA